MQLAPLPLQVFMNLVVIMAAAFVALIVDYLKANNEQLRELTIELKVRREEEHERMRLMTHARGSAASRTVEDIPASASAEVERARQDPAASDGLPIPSAPATKSAFTETADTGDSGEVLPEAPFSAAAPQPRLVETPAWTDAEAHSIPAEILAKAMASKTVAAKKDWNSLLASRRGMKSSAPLDSPLLDAVLAAAVSEQASERATNGAKIAEPALPAGFHNASTLAEFVSKGRLVSGLVMSIGVSTPPVPGGSERVRRLIQTLLGERDFATETQPHEFLLLFPDERGAAAQRRLSNVAQQLWDFQFHALYTQSILFSWGGLEVRNEPIDEAIASAQERMEETRRARGNPAPVGFKEAVFEHALRQAV